MPSSEQHLAKERAAAAAEGVLRDAALTDWAITAVFYRAVHLVEAAFALRDLHHSSHVRRAHEVSRTFPAIEREYTTLLELSRTARYEAPGLLTRDDYTIAQQYFSAIEAAVSDGQTGNQT